MELDSFLSTPRWDILKIIIQEPSAPMEIAKQLGITTSFVSQQLKLLEAAGLVTKQKTGAFEKGKPRSLFSISGESLYIVPLAKNAPDKTLLSLSVENKITINIWTLKNKAIQIPLQKFLWSIQSYLKRIYNISIYTKSLSPKVYITSQDKSLTHQINETQKNIEDKVAFQVISSPASLEKLDSEHLFSIYTSQEIATEQTFLKGGLK